MTQSRLISHAGQWPSLFKFFESLPFEANGRRRQYLVSWGPPKRSNSQNRYLWGVVYREFARGLMEQGKGPVDVDSLHYICSEQFLPRLPVGQLGKSRPMSTTQLCRAGNENSFQDYVEQIKALASHYGIYIPDPGEGQENG